jgi:hypothetical protein
MSTTFSLAQIFMHWYNKMRLQAYRRLVIVISDVVGSGYASQSRDVAHKLIWLLQHDEGWL